MTIPQQRALAFVNILHCFTAELQGKCHSVQDSVLSSLDFAELWHRRGPLSKTVCSSGERRPGYDFQLLGYGRMRRRPLDCATEERHLPRSSA